MTLYNVRTPIVGMVKADTPAAAIARHEQLLRHCGHEVYPDSADAFQAAALYRVRTPVVGLVIADTAAAAVTRHERLLRECGHDIYPEGANAFESEPTEDPAEFI